MKNFVLGECIMIVFIMVSIGFWVRLFGLEFWMYYLLVLWFFGWGI